MHVEWNGNKFDQLFILSLAYCFPFYTPQTSLKISLTKLHRPPSCNKSWRRRQSKCSETWIEDNFFSEPWLQDVCQYASKHRNHPEIYSKIIRILILYPISGLDMKLMQIFSCKIDHGNKTLQSINFM